MPEIRGKDVARINKYVRAYRVDSTIKWLRNFAVAGEDAGKGREITVYNMF